MDGQTSKKKYDVRVTRTYVHAAIIEVEAEDPREAELLAYDMINDTILDIDDYDPKKDTAEVVRY